jgi:tRNA-2-methylthio-N6-dimethylallyladenosine synthase
MIATAATTMVKGTAVSDATLLVRARAEAVADGAVSRGSTISAWLPIIYGCDKTCTYCIVPFSRGPERSRPFDEIVAEARALAVAGYREVTLLGQNVNSYGRDLYGSPAFARMLRSVAATGIERIRFATSHPKDLSDDTIEAMAELPAVMPYLHLPLQSGSNAVLERMNRVYTREDYLALVERLYERVDGLALSTDIIVGFPGETEADFEATLDAVRRARYTQAFTFIYSPRAGTPAATMGGRIARDVVQARFDRLVEVVQRSALDSSRALVGTVQDVLIEGPSKRDPAVLTGRTPTNKVVHVRVESEARAGELAGTFARIRVDEAQTWFLTGEIVDV